jgi:hypothetical protein
VRTIDLISKPEREHSCPLQLAQAPPGCLRRPAFSVALASFALSTLLLASSAQAAPDTLAEGFAKPPAAARPWVYWFIMDGNVTREGITADFEAMKRAGLGGLIMMEVDAGIPKGPVGFMTPEWRALFAHAVKEAERLGLQMTLNAGPGWTGSGGPWVKPEQSMQHLVSSSLEVSGPKRFDDVLPLPKRRPAFFGDEGLPPELERARNNFYRDVAVVAFPTPTGSARIPDIDEKALYVRAPYSSQPGVKAFLPSRRDYEAVAKGSAVESGQLLDLTDRLAPDGRLIWDVPPGSWTLMRFGSRSTGANTRPAPAPGIGLESDKFDPAALDAHFEAFVRTLLRSVGPGKSRNTGWTSLHIDSWEMGAQNWTAGFRSEFRKRRGYDMLRYMPVMSGRVVDSREISERFLWDLRQTAQELVLQNHAEHLKKLGRREGLGLSIEPYDMNPCADMSLGGVADVPMCEFWLYGFNTSFTVLEAASIAHTLGRPIVAAEAFTSGDAERWQAHPGSMKALGDWAFCAGVNRIVFHRYQHQPWLERRPGMTMGPYGVHWERTQTWWDMVPAYHEYLARCQFLLRKGLPVADVCFLVAEGAPHVFRPPAGATRGNPPDRLGYNFDACAPETLLTRASVRKGQIVLPDGMSYRVLVLPESPTMTPVLLRKVRDLVRSGATVIGPRPAKSPSLSQYPGCDVEVQKLASELWGQCDGQAVTERNFGRGRVIWETTEAERAEPAALQNARWIWHPEANPAVAAPVGTRWFRREFNVQPGDLKSAMLHITADNSFVARLNDRELGIGDNFNTVFALDAAAGLRKGANVIAIKASNGGDSPNPAGLVGALVISFNDGRKLELHTDSTWESSIDEESWTRANDLGPFGMAPWQKTAVSAEPEQYGRFATVEHTLRAMGVAPDFEADHPLRYLHRQDGKTDIYFVANPEERPVTARCTFRVARKQPELWDPLTGSRRSLSTLQAQEGSTTCELEFAPHQSIFVVFGHKGKPSAAQSETHNFENLQDLTGPWEVTFDPSWGGPGKVIFQTLEDWSKRAEPGIRFYSGTAIYRKNFDLARPVQKDRVFMELGPVKNLARLRLNGQDLGVLWCAPWRIEVTGRLRPTGNELEVSVANLWPNRLIGDSALPEKERLTWTTWNPFKAGDRLLESGLLGPVKLQIEPGGAGSQ